MPENTPEHASDQGGNDAVAAVLGDAGPPSARGGGGGLGRGLIIGALIVGVVLLLWIIIVVFLSRQSELGSEQIDVEGKPAPDFTLPLLFGDGEVTLSEMKGKPVMLNFWASWCGPCKDEGPVLADAYRRWKGSDVQFMGVDVADSIKWGREFEEHYGIGYDSGFDETGATGRSWGITGYPETFLIDADGLIVAKWVGPFQSPEQIDEYLSLLDPDFRPKPGGEIVAPPEPDIPEQPAGSPIPAASP